jgi:hypothetical protein
MPAAEVGEVEQGTQLRSNRLHALIGTLPFLLFGILSMLTKARLPFSAAFIYAIFYGLILMGFLAGMLKAFPPWAYAYLGWALFGAWWWSMMPLDSFTGGYSPILHNIRLGSLACVPLLLAAAAVLLRARSLAPLRPLVKGIWENWPYLSLVMYAFAAYVELIYDENHHPFLLVFMAASTIAMSAGAWFFLRSSHTWAQVLSLAAGFAAAAIISSACYATWDWAAYYGFPESPAEPWYMALAGTLGMYSLWAATLFWPAILGLARLSMNRHRPA